MRILRGSTPTIHNIEVHKKTFSNMTNPNNFSEERTCSQETTTLMDEETYKELEQNLGREL